MSSEQHKLKITYLLSYASIFCTGPWRNSIELWTGKGHSVTLIQFKDDEISESQISLEKRYNLIQVPFPFLAKGILYLLKCIFRSLSGVGLRSISTFGDGVDYFLKGLYFIISVYLTLRNADSDVYIGGDPPSLVAAYLLSKRNNKKLVFWELELLLEKELMDFGRRLFKRYEKKCCQHAVCAVEFGEKRCELLRKENEIPDEVPIFSIPNSLLGDPKLGRNYYFNEKLNIPKEKKIVLLAGSIFVEIRDNSALWESFEYWDESFVLVLHSRSKSRPVVDNFVLPKKLKESGRIFFNDEPVPYEKIETIYASCDIGLILMGLNEQMNSNHFYSDLSLGKLFHFLYSGVPVVSRRLFGYGELIDNNGVGLCFDDPNEIGILIKKIIENERYYKENCIRLYKRYAFDKYHLIFEDYVKQVAAPITVAE